jgi:hypothetical protein
VLRESFRQSVVPLLCRFEAVRTGVANQPHEPIVRPIHPCTDYLETFLLPQGHDATFLARNPVIHVSGLDPVVPQLNLHDFEYPLTS